MGQDHQATPASKEIERGKRISARHSGSVPEQKELWGSDAIAAMLRALDIPYLALNPGASYRGLHDSHRQLPRQRAAADAALPARGVARWRSRTATPRRPGGMMGAVLHSNVGLMHAHDGDLQRLVRPRADADPRRDRPVGRGQAPALDRLDPHRVRPGRAGARLHQVGQPARVGAARRTRRCCAPRRSPNTAPRGPTYVNLDAALAGGQGRRRCRRCPIVTRYQAPPSPCSPRRIDRRPRRSSSRQRRTR